MFLDVFNCRTCGRDWPGTHIDTDDPDYEAKKAKWLDWIDRLKRDHALLCPGDLKRQS